MSFFKSARLKSSNFIANIAALILSGVGAAAMVPQALDVDQTLEAIISKNWGYIAGTAVPLLVNFVSRVIEKIKAGQFALKRALGDPNFWMHLVTLVAFLLASVNVMLPEGAPEAIVAAINVGTFGAIITAVATYILNPIWHAIFDNQPTVDEEAGQSLIEE